MLSIGDTIKCRDTQDMVQTAEDLHSEGYGIRMDFKACVIEIVSLPEQ